MKTIARKTTKPYCTCVAKRNEGYTRLPGTDKFVHPTCMKVSKGYWERLHRIDLFP